MFLKKQQVLIILLGMGSLLTAQSDSATKVQPEHLLQITIDKAIQEQQEEDYMASINLLAPMLHQHQTSHFSDSLLGVAYHKLGVAYYYEEMDSAAIENFTLALNYKERHYPVNHIEVAKTYRNIGNIYNVLNQFDSATVFLQHSLDWHFKDSVKDTILLAQTHKDLGLALATKGDIDPATIHLQRALNLFLSQHTEEELLWEIYQNLWTLYHQQKNVDSMYLYANALLHLVEKSSDDASYKVIILADCYNDLGITYYSMNTLDTALMHYQKAIHINRALLNRTEALATNYSNISIVYKKLKNYKKALYYINKAILLDQHPETSSIELAKKLNNKASILGKMEQLDASIELHQQAIALICPSFKPNNPYSIPSTHAIIFDTKPGFIGFLKDKAAVQLLKYKKEQDVVALQAAVSIYDTIAVLLHEIRIGFEADGSKRFLAEKAHPILEEAITATYNLYQITQEAHLLDKAFQFIEQAKAMIILDALSETNASKRAGIPKALLDKEKRLKQQIHQLEKNSQFEATAHQQDQLIKVNRELALLIDTFKQNYPKYAQIKYANKLLTLAEIPLDTHQTLINYFVGAKQIYSLVMNEKDTQLIRITKDFRLDQWVQLMQHTLKRKNDKEAAETLMQISYQLYEKIFAPIVQQAELTEALMIIPDGVLGYVPFDCLISQPVQQLTDFHKYSYLVKKYRISYNYSVSLYKEMNSNQEAAPQKNIIAVAPDFDGVEISTLSKVAAAREKLVPLDNNLSEVEEIRQLIPSTTILKKTKAKKATFLKIASQYKIFHLATHAKANDEKGDFAWIAFNQIPNQPDQSFLYNQDLYNLQLPADMVVLSACETGVGPLQKGEGIISLARGFSYAGARSIITTLWSINDEQTHELMVDFYDYLQKEYPKDKALRQAKLDFINNPDREVHPYYWAAFTPIGTMQPITFVKEKNSYIYWALLLLGLLALVYWQQQNTN